MMHHLINEKMPELEHLRAGCGRPAVASREYSAGAVLPCHGRICECIDSPLCRHHHRCKRAEGWRLEQPEPGVLVWHTPAGRSYATIPTVYLH